MRLFFLALGLALCAATACEGETKKLSAADLPRVVLQPSDLAGFSRFDEGRLGRADFQPGPRAEPDRFGREDGWKARYRRTDPSDREGALVVESKVDLFEDDGGADEDLEAYGQELRPRQSGPGISAGKPLGDEYVWTVFEANGVFFVTVAWRYANVTASVGTQAFDRQAALEAAFDLASRQQRRIERALG